MKYFMDKWVLFYFVKFNYWIVNYEFLFWRGYKFVVVLVIFVFIFVKLWV